MAEKLDPEEWRQVMVRLHSALGEEVNAHQMATAQSVGRGRFHLPWRAVPGQVKPTAATLLQHMTHTAMCAILLILRTALEDSTLQAEMTGYEDYARQGRYRLCPGIW